MCVRRLAAVVMAAGQGSRMRSELPKPLHPLCGRPMLFHVLDSLGELDVSRVVVVVGHGAERVTKTVHEHGPAELVVDFVEQAVARGTGDAVSVALTAFPDDGDGDGDDPYADEGAIIVLPGDTPLVRPETLADLVAEHWREDAAVTLLTAIVDDPRGMGRVVRGKDGRVARIVEELDATEAELEVDEVGTSIYCFRRSLLAPALRRLSPQNAKGEYYLTDVVAVLHDAGHRIASLLAADPAEAVGVNDRDQLAVVEEELRRRINQGWMRAGVTMIDPATTYVDSAVRLAPDVTIGPGTIIAGHSVVGAGAQIGPASHLVDCVVGQRGRVEHSVAHDAEIGDDAVVGPFAVLLPGVHVPPGAVVGPLYTGRATDDEDAG